MQNHWLSNARIYHLLIDRFYSESMSDGLKPEFAGGTIKGIVEKLDYIKQLGANCLWISPFYKGTSYHGYHIIDYNSVDEHFGTVHDLQLLISEAHARGLKLIADIVPNHCSVHHPFFIDAQKSKDSIYRSWFYFDANGDYLSFLGFKELVKINLEHREARNYIIGNAVYWASMGFDGYRIDHVIGVPHSFLKEIKKACRKVNPHFVLIGEAWVEGIPSTLFNTLKIKNRLFYRYFGITQKRVQLQYRTVLDAVLDFECRNILLSSLSLNTPFSKIEKRLKRHFRDYKKDLMPVLFLDNHDTNRIMFECHNDKELVGKLLKLLLSMHKPLAFYSGTEQLLSHKESVQSGKPYADVAVRIPMDWKNGTVLLKMD